MSVLEKIPRGEPYRMTALSYTFIPNAAGTLALEDVRGYEAMTLGPFFETFPLWCVPQPVWYNRVDDPTKPFVSFLNVRWVLQPLDQPPPPSWPLIAEGEGLRLLENPRVLPRAFVPRRIRAEPYRIRRLDLLKAIEDFGERGVVDETGGGGATEDWRENGDGRVRIAAYGAGHGARRGRGRGDGRRNLDPGVARVEGRARRPRDLAPRLQPCLRRRPGSGGPAPRRAALLPRLGPPGPVDQRRDARGRSRVAPAASRVSALRNRARAR
jgi:hypothetical protein